jgi:hypothetical protein
VAGYCPLSTIEFFQPFQSTISLFPQPTQPKEWVPFSDTQSLRMSIFPSRIQHMLEKKYLCGGLQESTATHEFSQQKLTCSLLHFLAHNITHSPRTYFSMNLQLQSTITHSHYGFLQYLVLKMKPLNSNCTNGI